MFGGSVSRNDPMAITLKNLYSEVVICWPAAPGQTRGRHSLDVFMRTHSDALRAGFAVLLLSLLSITTMAAGGDFHVLGIVMVIDTKHIEVKTSKGSIVSVLLNKQVKFKTKATRSRTSRRSWATVILSDERRQDQEGVRDSGSLFTRKDCVTISIAGAVDLFERAVHESPFTEVRRASRVSSSPGLRYSWQSRLSPAWRPTAWLPVLQRSWFSPS